MGGEATPSPGGHLVHLLQTSRRKGKLSRDDLKRNLFAILTISDELMPGHNLKAVADELYSA
jgi:hypothetical protein